MIGSFRPIDQRQPSGAIGAEHVVLCCIDRALVRERDTTVPTSQVRAVAHIPLNRHHLRHKHAAREEAEHGQQKTGEHDFAWPIAMPAAQSEPDMLCYMRMCCQSCADDRPHAIPAYPAARQLPARACTNQEKARPSRGRQGATSWQGLPSSERARARRAQWWGALPLTWRALSRGFSALLPAAATFSWRAQTRNS